MIRPLAFVCAALTLAGCGASLSPAAKLANATAVAAASTGTRTALVNGVKLAYTDMGKGTTAVVFIHGFPLSRHMWDAQVAALSTHERVVALDLPGFGESAAPASGYTMPALADEVSALLTRLHVDHCVLVGHSMGGYVAQAFADRHPDQLLGLALVATDAEDYTADPADTKSLLDLATQCQAQGPQPAIDSLAPIMLATDDHSTTLAARVRTLMAPASAAGVVGCLQGMATRPGGFTWMSSFKRPTFVIAGSEDQVIAPTESQKIAAAIPGAELTLVPGLGHLLMLEQPDTFNAALQGFVKKLIPGS